jgi:hypothetical protein
VLPSEKQAIAENSYEVSALLQVLFKQARLDGGSAHVLHKISSQFAFATLGTG